MKSCHNAALFLFFVLAFLLQSRPLAAQTSTGYTDSRDTTNLLEYRLPDWSYRIWDASFDFSGNGSDFNFADQSRLTSSNSGSLSTRYNQNWDSEQRIKYWSANLSGTYYRNHLGANDSESRTKRLTGAYNLGAGWREYLGQSRFSVNAFGNAGRSYTELKFADRNDDVWTETSEYNRSANRRVGGGVAWGRARNVVPLLRAERLSERLTTLGRPPLTRRQVQEMARILATETGYRQVFDRSDRHFWRDVLEPMLDGARPLDPYEIFYLADVLDEDLGDRYEGFVAQLSYTYSEDTTGPATHLRNRSPQVSLSWYHNFTLTQQVHVFGRLSYDWYYRDDSVNEGANRSGGVAHIWNLADRYRLDTTLAYAGRNQVSGDVNRNSASLSSQFHIYLEDQVSLVTRVRAKYTWDDYAGYDRFGWTWDYRLGLTYHLDRAVF